VTKNAPHNNIVLNERAQIQYLLGNPPGWMMRYGLTMMAGVFMMLIALVYLVHYPDVIVARVVLTTARPPIRLLSKQAGRVAHLLVKDRQMVEQGQVLAVLENTASWRDVLQLELWISDKPVKNGGLPSGLRLGDLQASFSAFSQHWKDMQYFTAHHGTAEQIAYIEKQIKELTGIHLSLGRQFITLQEEFTLSEKEYKRQQLLHKDGIISDKEFERSETEYLAQKRTLQKADETNLQNQLQIRQLESQINELLRNKSNHQNEKELTLAEDIQRLASDIAAWKQQYLIVAPIMGGISFSKVWSEQQFVAASEEIMAVVPTELSAEPARSNTIVGKARLSVSNSGKVAVGQRVFIRLDGYPSQQYGALKTSVAAISLLPQENEYALDLFLPDSLITSSGKYLPFRQEMSGQARIITEDRRIIDRIFGKLSELLQHQ